MGPRKAADVPFRQIYAHPAEESVSIGIVEEDIPFFDPASVNVMQRPREIDPWSSWHARFPFK
jgi:hypothetical protein